jgi:uncharacterized protein YjbI with pentapeptide repeats
LIQVSLQGCNFRFSNFSSAKFEQCSFDNCDFKESFFNACLCKNLELDRSDFTGSDFSYASLNGLDFSTCEFTSIHVSEHATALKGIIVNVYQAADLARLFGILIKDANF